MLYPRLSPGREWQAKTRTIQPLLISGRQKEFQERPHEKCFLYITRFLHVESQSPVLQILTRLHAWEIIRRYDCPLWHHQHLQL